ncbi:MAG: serine/threonine protein kinase [Wenzhouxiangella sp.]|nr:MAG: serine/threonine protein kinase [Wenzhouxiangella sp.]
MSDNDDLRWQRQAALFDELADLPAQDRHRRLAEIESEDAEQAAELKLMLAADAASGVLDRSLDGIAPELTTSLDRDRTGTLVDRYRLIEIFGRGGMGEVWLARREDEEGAGQQVAIKILRRGMNSEDIVARFIQERRILASLEHPGIARFIDGGMTEDSLPYFVMERVQGLPITEHARHRSLSVRDRMRLLLAVCDAVAYAQQRLVVHRDLKPSNVLVDEHGRVRLLDFGIAKLLEDQPDGRVTATGLRAMSPAYAAPEQILGQTISTATDVYALGLLGYELLTDTLPHRRGTASLVELASQLYQGHIERPSQILRRVSTTQPDLTSARYRRELTRDLELVLLKALRPEPERRYPSAAALAADLRRWLDGEAVLAAGDSTRYRLKKFLSRYRGAVAATVLVILTLAGGLATALHQAAEAQRQAERADLEAARAEMEAETAIAQAALAREQAKRARRAVAFLTSLFRDDDPMMVAARGRMTMDEVFEEALSRIDSGFEDDPALKADLLDDFGEILAVKGRLNEAETRIRQALELAVEAHGHDHPAVAESLDNLTFLALMRGDVAEALGYSERSLPIREQHKDADLAAYAVTANNLGVASFHSGRLDEAARWLRVSFDGHKQALGEDSPQAISARNNLGAVLITLGRYDEGEAILMEALAAAERRGEGESAAMLPLLSRLVAVAYARGNHAAEAQLTERRLALARSLYPGDHGWHADAMVSAGELEERRGGNGLSKLAAGTAMYARLGNPDEAEARGRWAVALARRGNHEEALAVLGPVASLCAGEERSRSTNCVVARQLGANALVAAGKPAEALADIDGNLVQLAVMFADDNRYRAEALEIRGRALYALGRGEEARADLEQALAILVSIYGDEHESTRRVWSEMESLSQAGPTP